MERSLTNKFILDLSRLKIGMVQVVASNLSKITIIGMQSTSKQRQSIFKRLKNLIQLSKCINKVNLTLQAFQVRQQSLTQIKKNKDVVTVPEATTSYMTYNETGKVKGLDNLKIRQALNLATDRKGIVEAAVDTGSVLDRSNGC
mgnify:FL=1